MKILLACAGGMSTSILMKKVEAYAKEHGIEPFEIKATSTAEAPSLAANYDVILIGPQVGYQKDEVEKACKKPTAVIPTEIYGSANSKAVIELAQKLIDEAGVVAETAPVSAAEEKEPAPAREKPEAAASEAQQPQDKQPSGFLAKLQHFGEAMQTNNVVRALSNGMMGTMGLILAGAVFSIIATIGSMVGAFTTDSAVYQWLQVPYNMTMNAISICIAFGVAYSYTQNLGRKGAVANGFVAMILFLIVCAPFQSVTLADGTTKTVMDTTYLGGAGIFTALIMPILIVKLIVFCQNHHVTIKMPDVVPPFLSDSFATMIPLLFNILIWYGIGSFCEGVVRASLPGIIMGILSAPLSVLVSGPGMIVLVALACLFWCFGIHGSAIVYMVIMAPMMQAYAQNAALVAAGQAPVFSAAFLFAGAACCGGTGNVFPLALHCMRAKSEKLKAIGKVGIVPAAFNISEPMVFGLSIMFNPIIDIPFVLNAVVTTALLWAGYAIGFFQPSYVLILTTMPLGVGEFLNSMAWQNLFIPVLGFVVGYLLYAPFVRIYDKQCLAEEAKAAAAEHAAA